MPKEFLKRFFFFFIPAFLIFYGSDKLGYCLFSDDKTVEKKYELVSYIIGFFITSVLFPVDSAIDKNRLKKQSAVIQKMLKNLRESLNTDLASEFNVEPNINIRVFLPKKGGIYFFKKILFNNVYFAIKNYQGLYTDEVENLTFKVSPKPQGLVGMVYVRKIIAYDFSLKSNVQNAQLYNLNANQRMKTEHVEFACAAPIFKDDTEKIAAIITFDTSTKLNQPNTNNWQFIIKEACQIVHSCIPFIYN